MTINACSGICQDSEPIHLWFGLSYSNYLVVPRAILQSMPTAWQQRFAQCLEELGEAASDVQTSAVYHVQAAREEEIGNLLEGEYLLCLDGHVSVEYPDGEDELPVYYVNGEEREADDRVLLPVPDPVPHYNRGRTRISLNGCYLNHGQQP